MLVDRASGLVAIGCWFLIGTLWLNLQVYNGFKFAVPVLLFIGVWLSKITLKQLFNIYNPLFFKSLLYSLVIQGLQIICVFWILKALHLSDNYFLYLTLFLISSVLSIFSFSGIGVREYIFYQSAQWFDFNPDVAVSVGLTVSIITLLSSLPGIFPALFTKFQWIKLKD